MIIFETICVAFAMFSALPVPQINWDKENMRYSLVAFPLIGAVSAVFCWLWHMVCGALGFPAVLQGAGWCLIPVLVTGGIHLDGYADTWDALASHGTTEQKQEILKDPHIGTFAVLHIGIWFVAYFALWTALPEFRFLPVLACFCLSRTLSGLALTVFPMRPGSGLAKTFSDAAEKGRVRTILLVFTAGLCVLLCANGAWSMIPAAGGVLLVYRHLAEKTFGGASGDLAGWFLQTAELWMLGIWVLQQFLEGRI